MPLLNSLDIGIIVTYLAAISYIGARFYRKNSSMSEYLLGNKRMGWLPVALSILAADTSAISYLGIPAWSFRENMKLNQQIFTYFIAIPVVILLFLPVFSKANLYTAYQYLEGRFDVRVRLMASAFFLVIRGAHVAIIIYAPALMMSEIMGVPLNLSVVIMGLLTAFYTSMGGIRGVIWTDAIQVVTVLAGFTTIFTAALNNIPGGVAEVIKVGAAGGKFQFLDLSFSLAKVDNFWAITIGGSLLAVQAMSSDQAVLQKYFTTKSNRETAKALLCYGVVIVPLVTMLSILGVILFAFYHGRPDISATLKNTDAVVPHFAARMLPHGLAGMVVASIFAGSMSTVSASLNSLATSSVIDIYKRMMVRNRSERHYTLASRWATLGWGVLATVGALFAGRLGALVLAFIKIHSLLGGVILGMFLLGIATRRTTSGGAIAGSMFGLAIVSWAAAFTPVTMFWYCAIGCACTIAAGWSWSRILGTTAEGPIVAPAELPS